MVRIKDKYNITKEPISLTFGIIGIVLGLFYFFSRMNFLESSFYITNNIFTSIFGAYALISGIIITYKIMKNK